MTTQLTATRFLAGLAARHPASPALHYRDSCLTFSGLQEESLRVARALTELGVGPGDRVALWLPNTPAWLACFFACCRIGAIVLATNTRFRSAEMEDILGRSEAKVLVYWPAFRGIDFSAIVGQVAPAALRSLQAIVAYRAPGDPELPARLHGIVLHDYASLARRPAYEHDAARSDAGCLMFTTSGTTKAPKFVLHSQGSIVQHAHDVARGFGYLAPDTVGLGVLPFCGTYGFSTTLAPLAAGAPVAVLESFEAHATIETIRRLRVTNTNLSGDMIGQIVAAAPPPDVLRTLRFVGCGSGCPQWIAPAQALGMRLAGVYGSSEVQALFSHQNAIEQPLAERAAGGGHAMSAHARVRARDVETGRILAHGESGALEISAPSQLQAYFGNAAASAEAFTADGYVRTGDLGCTLADGRFVYLARMGDVLRLSGFLVSPAQIESVVAEHPAVSGCQVVGIDHAGSMRPFAFVTLNPGCSCGEAELLAFARARMARYKIPERIVCIDAFPTVQSANAIKVQKTRLRDMALALIAPR